MEFIGNQYKMKIKMIMKMQIKEKKKTNYCQYPTLIKQ